MNRTIKSIVLLAALAIGALASAPSYSQSDSSFQNYQGDRNVTLEIDYENYEKVDHAIFGIIMLSRDRWKNWVLRTTIIISIFIAILIIFFSLPKNNEINLIVSYFLCGVLFGLSFWTTLAGWMLTRLNRNMLGIAFIACSGIMYVIFYVLAIRSKKSDISFSTLKMSFQKLADTEQQDKRLVSVSGIPGDWVEDDISR